MAELRPESGQFTYRRFAAYRKSCLPRFVDDDRRIFYLTDVSGQLNLWIRPTDPVLSNQQITAFEEEAVVAYDFSNDLSQLVVFTRAAGSGQNSIYSMDGLESWPLSLVPDDAGELSCGPDLLAPDAKDVVYSSNERDERRMDVVLLNTDTRKKRFLTDDGIYMTGYFSPDGNWLTTTKKIAPDYSEIRLINIRNKTNELPWSISEECIVRPGPWSPDGKGFYVLSEEGLESMGLGFFDCETESFEWVQRLNWDIECIALSNDGLYLAWVSNEDGYSRLCVKDYERDRIYSPPLPDGVMGQPSFSKDGASLVFELSTPRKPSSLYISDWGQNRVARPITAGFLGRFEEEELIEPNLIFYESEDGLKIPAFLYRPMIVDSTRGTAPVVISIHSKARGQARPKYNEAFQYLVNRGIGILAPNIRGSGGYGRTYESLLYRDWGGEMVEDIKAAVDYLAQLAWVDSDRIGIIGQHFGGYASLISSALLPGRFAATASLQGPCNLLDYIRSLPSDSQELALKLIGNPDSDRDLLLERSPANYAESFDSRLMIVQGADDRLVSEDQVSQFIQDLRKGGSDVEYLVLSGVGHEFVKKRNEMKAWRSALHFLTNTLLA